MSSRHTLRRRMPLDPLIQMQDHNMKNGIRPRGETKLDMHCCSSKTYEHEEITTIGPAFSIAHIPATPAFLTIRSIQIFLEANMTDTHVSALKTVMAADRSGDGHGAEASARLLSCKETGGAPAARETSGTAAPASPPSGPPPPPRPPSANERKTIIRD